ncbi:MAG: hypothetical protein ACREJ2_09830 [Planctomycetota bacterium]
MLCAGCDLTRPYDPLDEYESNVWTAASYGLQSVPVPGRDDAKDWPYRQQGLWPFFVNRDYFDGTRANYLAWPLVSHLTTPDGLQLDDILLVYRDARRELADGEIHRRTQFLWPLFEYRRKADETDFTLFPLIFWTHEVFPDARVHDIEHRGDSAWLPEVIAAADAREAAGLAAEPSRPRPLALPENTAAPALELPPIRPGAPVFSRASLSRRERAYDPTRDHERYRFWLFPIFFYADDTRLGRDVALIPLGGSISNFIGKERVWFFLFPLWAKTHEPAYDAQHVVWPFIAWWDGPGTPAGLNGLPKRDASGKRKVEDRRHGWRFLPFFSIDTWEHREFRWSLLWPFWQSEDLGLDTKYPTHVRSLFPLYTTSTSPRHKLVSLLTVFNHMSIFYDDGSWARTVWSIWPLFSFTHGDVTGLRIFPLWDSREDTESYYLTLLWPLFRAEHEVDSDQTVDTFQFGVDPLTILDTYKSITAKSIPLGQTEASQSPGIVRQTWWEVAQPRGDPVRFGRLDEANAFYRAQVIGRQWYDEGRVAKYWGPEAEDFPPTNAALRYLFKHEPPPPIDPDLAAAAKRRLHLTAPHGPPMFAAFDGGPASAGASANGSGETSGPHAPPPGPSLYPLAPRMLTRDDLLAAENRANPNADWQPTPPKEQVKVTSSFWPIYRTIDTQRDDLSVQILNPLFFGDTDGAMESQWGPLWNLYLYQNSAADTGRERALFTWWRRDWNGPAHHTELCGVFDDWRIDGQPDRGLFTLGGGWLWEGYQAPQRSFHGNMLFAVQHDKGRGADWWFLNGFIGHDHDAEGRRQWQILWMHF